ncbi:MAG: HPr kinase/phosphatase C-terminal domain-containing protein [Hyphomicrobiaceae bacterium]|nr:HPr kinase/phosphatase C-terminal domain-containing protein [Hyphomicrobiaceae bacterium]
MVADADELLVHGTCVAISGCAVLLRGAPGSGKSDLALRFISTFGAADGGTKGAVLVSDDQVLISRNGDELHARAPDAIAGKLEVRGVGIVNVDHLDGVRLSLIANMTRAGDVPRLPPEPARQEQLLGVSVPVLNLNPVEPSCPVKLKLALIGRP